MKKSYLYTSLFLLLFSYSSMFSQPQKGEFLIGFGSELSFGMQSSKIKTNNGNADGDKTTKFEFSPKAGYFIMNNLAIGIDIPLSYSKIKDQDDNESVINSYAVAPFVRYYFGSTNLSPFVYGEVGYGGYKDKYTPVFGDPDELDSKMFLYEVGGGLGIFFNKNISLDVAAGYNSSYIKPKEENVYDLKIVNTGFVFQVGLSVLF